jgi:hypothetical protein
MVATNVESGPVSCPRSRWHRDKPQLTYLCNFSITLVQVTCRME